MLRLLDQPAKLRGQGRKGEWRRAVAIDPRRYLDHRVRGKVRQGAVVSDVGDLDVACPGMQRGDELCRRFAVEGSATLLEKLGLLRQVGVAVQVEQLLLDGHHVLGA